MSEEYLDIDRPLEESHRLYLENFSSTRHLARDPVLLQRLLDEGELTDYSRIAVGLPIGPEGAFFVDEYDGRYGGETILKSIRPPIGQVSTWCHWTPTKDGKSLWPQRQTCWQNVPWIGYLILQFLGPWGYVVNGEIPWEDIDDGSHGTIRVKNNVVEVIEADP